MTRILAALALACVSACEPAMATHRPRHRAIAVPITVIGVGTLWACVRPPRRR